MHETLFHPAFWMPLALGILGIAVFIYGNARVKAPIRNAGLGILALMIAWMTMAYFVDTFTEKCVKRTDAIIASVETGNWGQLKTLLDNNTRLYTLRGGEQIASVAEQQATPERVDSIRILKHDVQPIPNGVDVSIDCIVDGRQSSLWTWTFSYESRSDGILLRQITPIRFNGQSVEQIERMIGRLGR